MSDTPDNLTTTIPPHPGTQWQSTTKAEAGADDKRSSGGRGYNARAGEVIAGNLARGGDGKFTSAGNATPAKPKPTTGRRAVDLLRRAQPPKKGRAKPKPKKGPKGPDPAKVREREQRRREAEARRAQREQEKLDRAVEADKKKRQQLADREARADAQKKRRAEVMARRAQREMDKLKRQQEPKGGGGGGGSAKKPKPAEGGQDAAKLAERTANRAKVGATLGQNLDPLASLADGAQPDAATAEGLVKAGLAARQADGTYTTTASGRSVLRAAERGDERQARAFLQRAGELRTNADTRAAARTARQAERERKRLERANRPKTGGGKYKSFVVYKGIDGQPYWVAASSTTFEDRDKEIVGLASLLKDVERTDASGAHGPLRFWHVPGWDVGDCDFRAVYGRTLIEAGTFRKPEYAAAIKADDQVSLGFFHPINQPGPDGVFTDIYTFERSIVPAGRASNPYTRLVVKEVQMMTDAKRKEFEARLGADVVASILGEAERTEKSADAMGVRHKGDSPPPVGTVATWDGEAWVTTKAEGDLPPEIPAVDAKAEGDMALDEEVIEEPVDEGGVFVGDMSPDEFMGMLQSGIAAALAPLTEALNIEAKMRGVIDEVKSTVGAYTTQKDATEAERLAQIEALKAETATLKAAQETNAAKLAELLGDQPRTAGFRASQAESTVISATHALKDAAPKNDGNYIGFFGLDQAAAQ